MVAAGELCCLSDNSGFCRDIALCNMEMPYLLDFKRQVSKEHRTASTSRRMTNRAKPP